VESARLIPRRAHTIDLQPWPFAGTPRVLVEHPVPETCFELVAELRHRGFAVALCSGPDALARCPLHDFEGCTAVAGADVVVTGLGLEREESRAVLRGLRVRYERTPLVVLAAVAEALELADELYGCTVLPEDAEPGRIADAVVAGLG
jgi:hypothetical protein